MLPFTLVEHGSSSSRWKLFLRLFIGIAVVFVFITSKVLLVTDYPMYRAYRLQVLADRSILIPHTLSGILALPIGPTQFLPSTFTAPSLHRIGDEASQ